MSKRKPIDARALQAVSVTPTPPIQKLEAMKAGKAPSRAGKVQISAFVSEDKRTRLKIVSAKAGQGISDLIEQAVDDLLAKHEE